MARIVKLEVAKWYYVLRLISIAFMLVLLVFVGIKLALSTIASEKAVYKQMLIDWVVGMIIVFSIHYIMLAIFNVNDAVVDALQPLASEKTELKEEYEYGLESDFTTSEMETTLYESARTRAYSLSWTDGFTGMIIYGVLVYFAWRFSLLYFLRVFNVVILTLVAPIIAASYAVNKVLSGKSKIFSGWLTEYIMTVIIQIFHVIIYTAFFSVALELSMASLLGVILAFALLKFMIQADKILRQFFKMVGGKGSLTGDMENIGFNEIKNAPKDLANAVLGGQIGMKAMKATYGVATKPIRAGIEAAFTNKMIKKANKADEEKKQKIDEMDQLKEEKREAQEQINKNKQEKARLEREKRNYDRRRQYATRKQKRKIDIATEANEREQRRLQREIDFDKERIENINDEISYKQQMQHLSDLEDKFYAKTFKGNIEDLFFDPLNYVEKRKMKHKQPLRDEQGRLLLDADGNPIYEYNDGKYHKIRTRRKDAPDLAIWREKTDSVGKKFAKNFKLKKMLNLSDQSEKELKKEFEFWKSTILGVFTSIIGWPALALNPTLGMALLSQSINSKAKFISRVRMLKNRPAYKKDKRYKFSAFSKNAQFEMQLELEREIKEAQRMLAEKKARKHPRLARKILNDESIRYRGYIKAKVKLARYFNRPSGISTIQQEKMLGIAEKEYVKIFKNELKELNELRAQDLAYEYKKEMEKEEEKQKDKAEHKSEMELLFADKLADGNVAQIGGRVFEINFKDDFEVQEEAVVERIEQISGDSTIEKKDKIRNIRTEIRQNKDELIKNQMAKYFSDNGIVDITKTSLKDKDVVQIKENIIKILEAKGIIKKGEIKLEDDLISSHNVRDIFIQLYSETESTNKILEEKMAIAGTKEFMQRNGIQNVRDLQTMEAQEGIYDIIKERMMSEDSKKSASVIEQITGRNTGRDSIELSRYLKLTVEDAVDSTEEANVLVGSQDRNRLVEKEMNRNMNRTKSKLEEAIFSDSSENIESQKELDMLFLLSELGQKNVEADKLGKKSKKVTKDMRAKIEYYQEKNGFGRMDESRDGSRRWDPNKDGSQKVVDDIKVNHMAKVVHGPSQDILDLINSI